MLRTASLIALIVVASSALYACASIQDGENEAVAQDSLVNPNEAPAPVGPHGLPPAAFEACASASDGADCSFELPALEIEGTCLPDPAGVGPLACAPADRPPPPVGPPGGPAPVDPGPAGPPPEAVSACANLAAATACTIALPTGTIDGTCRSGPDGEGPLACVPDAPPPGAPPGPPGHRHGGPPPEAVSACANLAASAACTIALPTRTIDGTCRSGPNGEGALACAPNAPPPGAPPLQ